MSFITKKNTSVFVIEEAVEGVYEPATSPTEAVQPLADGLELNPAKETLDRNILSGSIGKAQSRTGTRSGSGTIPCEFRASGTSGHAPDYDLLMKGALGGVDTIASTVTLTGNTVDTLNVTSGDEQDYAVGYPILVKEAGAFHVSPIKSLDDGVIVLEIAADSAFSDAVEIEAVTVYKPANTGHPSLTVEMWQEEVRKEYVAGCKVASMSLNNFSTGQLADLAFSVEGTSFDQSTGSLDVTPSYETSLPPVMLSACLYVDGESVQINELSLTLENSIGKLSSTCSPNGTFAQRVTDRSITGSFNPYKSSTEVLNFTRFNDNTAFSLFAFAHNPTGVDGEFNQVMAISLPQVVITEISASDADGVVQEAISFQVNRGPGNDKDEIFIACI